MVGLNISKNLGPFQGWSEERKRFFHQYGYDRGPGVIPSGEGFRSPVGKPKVQGKRTTTTTTNGDGTTKRVIQDTEDLTAARESEFGQNQIPTGSPWGQRLGEDALTFQDYGSSLEGLLAQPREVPTFERDQFTRAGMGGFTGGAQMYDMAADPTWSPDTAVNVPSLIGGTGVQYEGGDESDNLVRTMDAIKIAESRGDPLAHNPGTPENPEDSIGGFQINWDFWGQGDGYDIINNATKPILGRDLQREDLFNEQVNDAAGYAIQASEGYGPWSTYNDGTYLQHLAEDPNLFQGAGSGIVEGIKSAWGEPTTQSGVGFDKPPHTAETPDFTREDAPEGIPQEIYNQLRDNHHFGSQLGVISEAGAAEGALPGSSYIGQDDREFALAFQAEQDRKKRIQDQMAQGQMPPPRYEDAGLLGGPSEADPLDFWQQKGYAETGVAPGDINLMEQLKEQGLYEEDVAGSYDPPDRFGFQGPQLSSEIAELARQGKDPSGSTILHTFPDGTTVSMGDVVWESGMMLGTGGAAMVTKIPTLIRNAGGIGKFISKNWQKIQSIAQRKRASIKPGGGYQGGKAQRFEEFKDVKTIPPSLRPQVKPGQVTSSKYPSLSAREKAWLGGTAATLAGTEYIRQNVEKLPWVFKRGVERAGDLEEKIEQVVTEKVIPTAEDVVAGLLETPAEHEVTLEYPDTELGEYGREGIEEETFDPPGLLEKTKPIEVAAVSQEDLHDKFIEEWTPYKNAVGSMMEIDEMRKAANEPLDESVNRIWANFPTDIEGKTERYLQALGEMYKKVAILNVIAALTNSPSMAPEFMKLAAERFKTLEGFRGEERLQRIAKGVYFTQDGKFDAPRSKQEAYERAIQFGATAKEAATISGYMEDKEDEDQYYRDDGKGGWETMRSDTDPRGNWTRGTPSGKSPSAVTGAYSPAAIEKKHDLLDRYIDERNETIESGASTKTIDYKIKTLRDELDKSGVKESRSDLFNRLYDKFFKSVSSFGRIPKGAGSINFRNWLLTTKEGKFQASVHLGSAWEKIIKEHSPQGLKAIVKETEEELVDKTILPSTRKDAEKYMRTTQPKPPDMDSAEYERKLKSFLDDKYGV